MHPVSFYFIRTWVPVIPWLFWTPPPAFNIIRPDIADWMFADRDITILSDHVDIKMYIFWIINFAGYKLSGLDIRYPAESSF